MKDERRTGAAPTVPPALQARVLHEALPYVQSVQGKIFVVRCEGHWLSDPVHCAGFARDAALLHLVGLRLVLVYGAQRSPAELYRTRSDLVGLINQQGCRAVGLTTRDGGRAGLADGLIQRLHARGFIPVVVPLAEAADDADALAGDLAQRLCAEKLLMLGDWPGVLDRDGHLVATLSARDMAAWPGALPAATRKALDVALAAVAHGVKSAHIIDGRRDHALLLEVLSNAGDGTIVLPEQAPHFLDDSLRYLHQGEPGADVRS